MTTYAIGDIQGCSGSLEKLLASISFDASADRLWLTGDLVNRGPDSLGALRRLVDLGDTVTAVLGNHDLHLLAIAAGASELAPTDTIGQILRAPDADELIDWLRQRPLMHYDQDNDRVLVHAGLPPAWTLTRALGEARKVAEVLTADDWREGLSTMYGDRPESWTPTLTPEESRRYTINALTRVRFCRRSDGALDFTNKGPPGSQPDGLEPWFDFPRLDGDDAHIIFGHWASLGLLRRADVTCLDSGCVWGRSLTALPIDPPGEPVSIPCP